MRFESWKWKALNFPCVILESDEGASRESYFLHSSKPTFYPIPSKHLITFPSKKYHAFLIFRQSVKKKNIPYFNEFAMDYLYYNIITC
ncbi:hypothetical protein D0812_10100 [Vibrio owensii]|uniref:Uncharacterized protein n=1 Tax=Vibrio owensii TaxID=696485 RepID=A0ABM6ZH51_9VIBR|nr:hypothetical protein D0812_10100 [Vibrio owensii]